MNEILGRFPKTRPALPPGHAAVFDRHFRENRAGGSPASSVTSRLEAWMHRQAAADVRRAGAVNVATLELGAGTLNHLAFEPDVRPYDIVEPNADLFLSSPRRPHLRAAFADVRDIPPERRYRRIVTIAVLEHLTDLPAVIARCGLLLEEGGTLRAGIPNEGTWLWRLGYRLTTGSEFRWRYQLDYETIMRHEHVNTADEVDAVLRIFFREVTCRVLGLNRKNAFYRFYACGRPDAEQCGQYVRKQDGG